MGSAAMIILDTDIWIWWANNNPRLTQQHREWIQQYQSQGLGVSMISCWEVAKLVENNRLALSLAVDEWLTAALAYPGVQLLNLTIPIIVESTKLTGFHRDPADQLIVATARIYGCPLLTADSKILAYPDVQTLK
jgi:PIN domain nuclease of toxin-antitoxin system